MGFDLNESDAVNCIHNMYFGHEIIKWRQTMNNETQLRLKNIDERLIHMSRYL